MSDRKRGAIGVSGTVQSIRKELKQGMPELGRMELPGRAISILKGQDALWALVTRPDRGGVIIRACHAPGGISDVKAHGEVGGDALSFQVDTVIGRQTVSLKADALDLSLLRITTELSPSEPLLIPFLPRDLYVLDNARDPTSAQGRVEAAQRGLNSGLIFLHIDEPAFGSVLYFQNLTALNDYFIATDTTPDAAVGGRWPELGYLPPTPPQSGTPPVNPLPAGQPVVMTDAIIVFHDDVACDEQDNARRFLQMVGAAYAQLDTPRTEFRDWVERADRTLHDLETSSSATISHYGHAYIHPYTGAEYPDVMVQMSVISALENYAAWTGKPIALQADLEAGLDKFYDPRLKTMRRYLPNVGKDKDASAVDSWYLYHPLLNLGHRALDGDNRARRLFDGSLDYAIRAAHHFKYAWPIQFKVDDFSVIVEARNDDGLGQTDVGGVYAYVMLQAYELTGRPRYLNEARAAVDAARGMRFELNYQANLTAWGASACVRLWRITNEIYYLRQSYVYLASFVHNCAIWESQIKFAKHYSNFFGVTCLHDGPYMALYECFDSVAALERYMKDSGPDLDAAARLLISEYCKYALHRAWFYYPDALPKEILATDIRNGTIDPKLSFPLEDLYHDGQPAGQVGQEIYGAGAAFVFASRSFHRVEGAPFRLFCDHFLSNSERNNETSLSFRLDGGDGREAALSIVRLKHHRLPSFTITTGVGDRVSPHHRFKDRLDYIIPANGRITLAWTKTKDRS
jgi:hypothetical protein